MANLTFKSNPVTTHGDFPAVGQPAPDFTLVAGDLSELSLADLKGKRVIFNIFPSVDTAVCALQLKTFSQKMASADNTVLLFASLDLPFAFSRFCANEGVENAITASDFRHHSLKENYGVLMESGPLNGLYARAVLVLDAQHNIVHSELVKEVVDEPDYDAAMAALASA